MMKAHVYVTLKTSVLDPQGQTIQNALRKIGFAEVTAVRQGKYFALSLADGLQMEVARAQVERIAREVLTNPVIEEFTYRIEEWRRRIASLFPPSRSFTSSRTVPAVRLAAGETRSLGIAPIQGSFASPSAAAAANRRT